MRFEGIAEVEDGLGESFAAVVPLSSGLNADLYRATTSGGDIVVAKVLRDGAFDSLAVEGRMLSYLRERSDLPVPEVLYESGRVLVMEYMPDEEAIGDGAKVHAAELLAALHQLHADNYGFDEDTLIGTLRQPNPWMDDWVAFFGEWRLLYMAKLAYEEGKLERGLLFEVEKLVGKLPELISRDAPPSLIHGDMWTGNVLCAGGKISGFVDPAIYYADPEIELAFSTLFGTFDEVFFKRYGEILPIDGGFFEERRDLYNLYPLLVHVRLFGGGYVSQVGSIVKRFVG